MFQEATNKILESAGNLATTIKNWPKQESKDGDWDNNGIFSSNALPITAANDAKSNTQNKQKANNNANNMVENKIQSALAKTQRMQLLKQRLLEVEEHAK